MAQVAVLKNRQGQGKERKYLIYENGKIMRVPISRKQDWDKVNYFSNESSDDLFNRVFKEKDFDLLVKDKEHVITKAKSDDENCCTWQSVTAKIIFNATLEQFSLYYESPLLSNLLYDISNRYIKSIDDEAFRSLLFCERMIVNHKQYNDVHFKFNIYDVKCDFFIVKGWEMKHGKFNVISSFVFTFKNKKRRKYITVWNGDYDDSICSIIDILLFAYKKTHREKLLRAIYEFLRQSYTVNYTVKRIGFKNSKNSGDVVVDVRNILDRMSEIWRIYIDGEMPF